MGSTAVDEAITWLEKANADLEPELLGGDAARGLLAAYARAEKLAAFGKTKLARKLDDATELARVSGTSVGKARATVDAAKALGEADDVRDAFEGGDISRTRHPRSRGPSRPVPGWHPSFCRWPRPSPSTCSRSGREGSCSKRSSTTASAPAST